MKSFAIFIIFLLATLLIVLFFSGCNAAKMTDPIVAEILEDPILNVKTPTA